MEKLKIGVLLSGSGTNLQAIIDEIAEGLPVEIVHVLSSRPDAYGIERARAAGIPVTVFDRSCYEDPDGGRRAHRRHHAGKLGPSTWSWPATCASSPRWCSTPSPTMC